LVWAEQMIAAGPNNGHVISSRVCIEMLLGGLCFLGELCVEGICSARHRPWITEELDLL